MVAIDWTLFEKRPPETPLPSDTTPERLRQILRRVTNGGKRKFNSIQELTAAIQGHIAPSAADRPAVRNEKSPQPKRKRNRRVAKHAGATEAIRKEAAPKQFKVKREAEAKALESDGFPRRKRIRHKHRPIPASTAPMADKASTAPTVTPPEWQKMNIPAECPPVPTPSLLPEKVTWTGVGKDGKATAPQFTPPTAVPVTPWPIVPPRLLACPATDWEADIGILLLAHRAGEVTWEQAYLGLIDLAVQEDTINEWLGREDEWAVRILAPSVAKIKRLTRKGK